MERVQGLPSWGKRLVVWVVLAVVAVVVLLLALLVTPVARMQEWLARKMNEKPNEPEGAEGVEE
jgi:Na+-transporting methylmalonyl-CoA/oxaloacetate decarboxylase gamma subunit